MLLLLLLLLLQLQLPLFDGKNLRRLVFVDANMQQSAIAILTEGTTCSSILLYYNVEFHVGGNGGRGSP